MNILNKESNRVLVQGLGRDGSFQTQKCIDFGTEIVSGVHPTKAGDNFNGIPIYGSVEEAVKKTSPDIGLIFVPAPFASDAICLLYTSPSPRDRTRSRMPSSA